MSNQYTDNKINLVLNKLTQEQYDKLSLSNMIQDDQLYLVTNDNGVKGDTRYHLNTKELQLSSLIIDGVQTPVLTCKVDDLAINTIQVSSNAYPVCVFLPLSSEDGGRDFCVRVEVLSSSIPAIAFVGSNSESCDFESTDENWATLEVGANLFNFTETKR